MERKKWCEGRRAEEEKSLRKGREIVYTRAKHGKAISVQPRFLVSANRGEGEGLSLREEAREFTCTFTCVHVWHRPWKRMNSLMNGRAPRDSLFLSFSLSPLLFLFHTSHSFLPLLLRIMPCPRTAYRRFPWNLTRTRHSVIDFAVVNDNQCLARWDFANGT